MMVEKLKRHVGAVLIGGFLLSGGLPGQQAWAHTTALRAPTCSNLPTAEDFYGTTTSPEATATITSPPLHPPLHLHPSFSLP